MTKLLSPLFGLVIFCAVYTSFCVYSVVVGTRWHDAPGGTFSGELQLNGTPQPHLAEGAAHPDAPQFSNSATEKFRVTSLPDIESLNGDLYAGSLPVLDTGKMSFMFAPKLGDPVNDIVVWFAGGPGCSGLTAFIQENGPFSWRPGMKNARPNPYSWTNLTNVLWVDQPIGAGFSVGRITAKTQEDSADQFLDFFKRFQSTFGIENYKVYLAGESYAGRYVPYVGDAMIKADDDKHFDLHGALMYGACIGTCPSWQSNAPVLAHAQKLNVLYRLDHQTMAQLESAHSQCGFQDVMDYLTFPPRGVQPIAPPVVSGNCKLNDALKAKAFEVNPCFNQYYISQSCPFPSDPLGGGYIAPGSRPYFDRKDVKTAIHAPDFIEWKSCGFTQLYDTPNGFDMDSEPAIIQALPRVIEKTNRVLIANGDFDGKVMMNGTLLSIQNMTWGGQLGFQSAPRDPFVVGIGDLMWGSVFEADGMMSLNVPQGELGKQHFERGLMWVEMWMTGHQVPQFQPRAAYKQLQWLLGHIDQL